MANRVLILSASAGAGHVRAAEALEKTIKLRAPSAVVEHIDVLKYTNKVFRSLYSKAYIELVNKAPQVLGWLYDRLDQPWKNEKVRLSFDRLNTGPLVKFLKSFQPDITISTHFLPSEIISWMKGRGDVSFSNNVVVTDFDVHAMWLCRNVDHYFVAIDETKVHLEALGIPSNKVNVTGIPIDPVFSVHKDRKHLQIKYGLELDRFTILVSAGGFGVGPVRHLVESISKLKLSTQAIIVCGRNESLKQELMTMQAEHSGQSLVKIIPIGYTQEIDEFMSMSDLFVGKPGGLTTSELLAKGVPLVVVNPIPGQEERNSDHLLEFGAAIRCNNLPALAFKIERLMTEGRLSAMSTRASDLGRPHAASAIMDILRV